MNHDYSIQEVATKLNLSDKTLRRWEDAGKFKPSRTLGNQRRYSLEDIQILDAIKHETIAKQSDLLTIEQAAALFGVTTTTIQRWENEGKIHPLITSGNTYYPRERLIAKIPVLKSSMAPEDVAPPAKIMPPTPINQSPVFAPVFKDSSLAPVSDTPRPTRLQSLSEDMSKSPAIDLRSTLTHTLITILILVLYHLVFSPGSATLSPPSGSVQGVTTAVKEVSDPRLDDLIKQFKDHLSSEMLQKAAVKSPTTINLAGNSFITGSDTMSKGRDQILVPAANITPETTVTATFTSDFAPAKKYWITPSSGSFTLHTDFPVAADSTFNYSYLVQDSTPSASVKPTPASTSTQISTPSAILN